MFCSKKILRSGKVCRWVSVHRLSGYPLFFNGRVDLYPGSSPGYPPSLDCNPSANVSSSTAIPNLHSIM